MPKYRIKYVYERWYDLDIEEDDVVWADSKGDTERHTYAYCVGCLPNQEEK